MSEAVMMALTKKGVSRQVAHELLRKLAIKSEMNGKPFREVLLVDKTVMKHLNMREIDMALKPENYLGTAKEQVDKTVELTKAERNARR
jgi:adenylosuccinate lyase